jgi:leucine efflux protein
MYVLSVAAQRGIRRGFVGACGVFTGDAILMTLAATGAAGVLKANPALFAVVKYAGGAYLTWLGLQMLRGAGVRRNASRREAAVPEARREVDASRPFVKALVISLMNPKAILFFVSFFVQFVDPAYPHPVLTFLALGTLLQFCSALYLATIIVSEQDWPKPSAAAANCPLPCLAEWARCFWASGPNWRQPA